MKVHIEKKANYFNGQKKKIKTQNKAKPYVYNNKVYFGLSKGLLKKDPKEVEV